MSNRLPIPDDLQHLVEKRETATRRDGNPRRDGEAAGVDSDATLSDSAVEESVNSECETEQRSGVDRRQGERRASDESSG